MRRTSQLIIAIAIALVCQSCGSDDNTEDAINFDRGPLLVGLTENVILPSYQSLATQTASLITVIEEFTATPNQANLQSLRSQWQVARLSWKTCEAFTFGPIDTRFLDTKMDLFPIAEIGLEEAIEDYNGSADYLGLVGSDKKGFGAIEYLLFGATDESILASFQNENRKAYLGLLSKDLNDIANVVLSDWQDGYADTFKSNTGNDAGASITLYTNDMIELIEVVKNFKLATPLGARTNSDALPDLVESPYANISKELIIKNLDVIQDVFTGGNGQGLDDYLNTLNIESDGQQLSTLILAKIQECKSLANSLTTLKDDVVNQPDQVQALLDATQELTNLTKADMMSQLGIIVTFSSNDGD